MARYEHIPVFQQVYKLTIDVYMTVRNFRREYKYTLGERLKLACHDLLDLVVIVNSSGEKLDSLKRLNAKVESLRINLRLAFDLRIISAGRLGELNRQIEEISRQTGGWQKWAAK